MRSAWFMMTSLRAGPDAARGVCPPTDVLRIGSAGLAAPSPWLGLRRGCSRRGCRGIGRIRRWPRLASWPGGASWVRRDEAVAGAQSRAAEAESRAGQAGQDAAESARADDAEAEQHPSADRDKEAGQPARRQPKSTTRCSRAPPEKLSGHAPILLLLRALGRNGAGCEKATEHVASQSAAKIGRCPESASRCAVRVRTHARGASLRRRQVHGDAQTGHSRVPPDYHWSARMSAHSGGDARGRARPCRPGRPPGPGAG